MNQSFNNGPVFPIMPFFKDDSKRTLNLDTSRRYIKRLMDLGATTVMTTAGTSQYHLLTEQEVFDLNISVATTVSFYDTAHLSERTAILGLPILGIAALREHIISMNKILRDDGFKDCCSYLVSYPGRFYNKQDLLDFLSEVVSVSDFPVLFHGLPLRNGYGGAPFEDYSFLANTSIAGIKEEQSTFDSAYKLSYDISKISPNFGMILAGKSMRRFFALLPSFHSLENKTWLAGVGNLFPEVELRFWNRLLEEDLPEMLGCIEIENQFFDVCFKYGWHPSLRFLLKMASFGGLGHGERERIDLTSAAKKELMEVYTKIIGEGHVSI